MRIARFRPHVFSILGSTLLLSASPALAATGPIATDHVRGTVSSVTATSVVVDAATGPVTVALDPKTAYIGTSPATVADIKPGTFVGTTNVMRDGKNEAVEVHIFPDSMRGTAEGDYAWDLPSAGHRSAMTNGTVAPSHASRMTNGTVHSSDSGQTIGVSYKGGTKRIVIPPGATIVRFDANNKTILKPGTHVLIIAAKSGSTLSAKAVVAGENGLVPPM